MERNAARSNNTVSCDMGSQLANKTTIAVLSATLLLPSCIAGADGDASQDGGVAELVNPEEICGLGASLAGPEGNRSIVGPCTISSDSQVELLNASGIRILVGNLVVSSGGGSAMLMS
jgi:hypothetical protein